ncbi:MAG: hypothetical protein BMS9Abin23_0094 [Thermodesulfobacteriota bacterium]|nr:MAG: hypothetical protein BMS9Abin23_0094 [Thermodesulfobacteriota bacterium]
MVSDIIKNMAALVTSGAGLRIKLRNVAWLFLENFPFDQCSIYMRDENGRGFTLRAFAGEARGRVERYAKGAALAYYVKKEGKIAEVYTPDPADVRWKRVEDRGLEGYRSVVVIPLMDGSRCYGVLYLKSVKKVVLGRREKKTLEIAVLQLVSILKFAEIILDYKEVVHDLEQARAKLLSARKMIHLGGMAAELTHEIKNPLISLGGVASRIRRKIEKDSTALPYVDRMIKEIKRLEDLVNRSVAPLKDDSCAGEIDDINRILEDSLDYFADELRAKGIGVAKEFFKGKLMVETDREELKIAFDNLIANAIQSMDKGGTLVLSTLLNDGWVVTEVADCGGGIDPRNMDAIFNPFFTTKEDGTGLGLPITSSIITRHKGVIDVDNRAGHGVTIKIKLPCAGKDKKRS